MVLAGEQGRGRGLRGGRGGGGGVGGSCSGEGGSCEVSVKDDMECQVVVG